MFNRGFGSDYDNLFEAIKAMRNTIIDKQTESIINKNNKITLDDLVERSHKYNAVNSVGMEVVETRVSEKTTSIPKRKHKKKRIQNKYIKKYGYKIEYDKNIYIMDGELVGHPEIIKSMKKVVKL